VDEIKVVRRSFEALNFPKGSPERERLNLKAETSEYMPSYRYMLSGGTRQSFRTKGEGEAHLKAVRGKP
jgi:hypothetical protein